MQKKKKEATDKKMDELFCSYLFVFSFFFSFFFFIISSFSFSVLFLLFCPVEEGWPPLPSVIPL
jgi:hypothetical protein